MREYIIFCILFVYFSIMIVGFNLASILVSAPMLFVGIIVLAIFRTWSRKGVFFASVGIFLLSTAAIFAFQIAWVKFVGVGQVGYGSALRISGSTITTDGYRFLFSMASKTALFVTVIVVISNHLKFTGNIENDNT